MSIPLFHSRLIPFSVGVAHVVKCRAPPCWFEGGSMGTVFSRAPLRFKRRLNPRRSITLKLLLRASDGVDDDTAAPLTPFEMYWPGL